MARPCLPSLALRGDAAMEREPDHLPEAVARMRDVHSSGAEARSSSGENGTPSPAGFSASACMAGMNQGAAISAECLTFFSAFLKAEKEKFLEK